MMNVRNLKTTVEKFRGIGISHDLNPKERDDIKHMIQEAKQAHDNLGTDATENYRFLVVGHGLRRKVLKTAVWLGGRHNMPPPRDLSGGIIMDFNQNAEN